MTKFEHTHPKMFEKLTLTAFPKYHEERYGKGKKEEEKKESTGGFKQISQSIEA